MAATMGFEVDAVEIVGDEYYRCREQEGELQFSSLLNKNTRNTLKSGDAFIYLTLSDGDICIDPGFLCLLYDLFAFISFRGATLDLFWILLEKMSRLFGNLTLPAFEVIDNVHVISLPNSGLIIDGDIRSFQCIQRKTHTGKDEGPSSTFVA